MIKGKGLLVVVLLALGASGPAGADPVEGLITFTAGTPARAAEVNDNFTEVADSVNDNDARLVEVETQVVELQDQVQAPDITVVPASAFLPAHDQASGQNVEYSTDGAGWVFKTGGTVNSPDFIGPVSLPNGVLLETAMLEACDDHNVGAITVTLLRCSVSDGTCTILRLVSTGGAEMPGCNLFSFGDLSETIDNAANRYSFFVVDTRNTEETRFRAVELHWSR